MGYEIIALEELREELHKVQKAPEESMIETWFRPTSSQHGMLHQLGIKHYHSGGRLVRIPKQEVLIA